MSSGEPLNPEIIEQVRRAWGLTLRDSYGQTETTMMVANSPGQKVIPGSMGRPCRAIASRSSTRTASRAIRARSRFRCARARPASCAATPTRTGDPTAVGSDFYRTGDVASRDAEGYLTYIGRADDVFKSSDYRLSPFELESALIEHEAVMEAAVVPAPDPMRFTTPKAYVVLAAGFAPNAETAASIFAHVRQRLSPYKRIRRIEFCELPKTASGKIRRVDLRGREADLAERASRRKASSGSRTFPKAERTLRSGERVGHTEVGAGSCGFPGAVAFSRLRR